MPVTVTKSKDLDELKKTLEIIEKKYYIFPRDEWVTSEEYFAFYGSGARPWDIDKCEYPQGNFTETLRQTAYEMEHGKPLIYEWTNVPKLLGLSERFQSDPEFKQFYIEKIGPLVSEYMDGEARTLDDTKKIIEQFNAIAEVAEEYKKKHNLKKL